LKPLSTLTSVHTSTMEVPEKRLKQGSLWLFFISKLIVNQSKSMYLHVGQVSSCLSPKILYLPWKCYIKTFEINIKIYILVACFIVFIQSQILMSLKPYSEPCFRRFSGTSIVDVCTEVRVLKGFKVFYNRRYLLNFRRYLKN
jgi:hypothetical protein